MRLSVLVILFHLECIVDAVTGKAAEEASLNTDATATVGVVVREDIVFIDEVVRAQHALIDTLLALSQTLLHLSLGYVPLDLLFDFLFEVIELLNVRTGHKWDDKDERKRRVEACLDEANPTHDASHEDVRLPWLVRNENFAEMPLS